MSPSNPERDKSSHLLIKELQNYPDHFHIHFRIAVVQFDKLFWSHTLKSGPPISANQLPLNSG